MPLPVDLAVEAAQRYITIYEMLTGQPFDAGRVAGAAAHPAQH